MSTNSPSFIRHQSLEATQVIPLFDSTSTPFSSTPPFKPKAGEVYVLKLDNGHESKLQFRRIPLFIRYIKSGNIDGRKTTVYHGSSIETNRKFRL
jgi:hypothetical protein